MSSSHFDQRQVRRNFGRAASTYEKHNALQQECVCRTEHRAHIVHAANIVQYQYYRRFIGRFELFHRFTAQFIHA